MVLRPGAGRKPRPEPANEPAAGRPDDAPAPLDKYRRMRDPDRTPEPFGGVPAASGEPRFVIQQHRARAMHWDFRLEIDGVLKSWAVPKGPSVHAEERRLAVHVEDHPLEYADFEGVIPDGNYGAGSVIVWDHGWYRPVKEGDPLEHLARGRLEVELHGFKLRGRWTLARMAAKGAAREGAGGGPGAGAGAGGWAGDGRGDDKGAGKDWLLLKKA